MTDPDPRDDKNEGSDVTPPAVPWLQALGIVGAIIVRALDVYGPSDIDAPWQIYVLFFAAIVSLGPDQAIRLAQALRGK